MAVVIRATWSQSVLVAVRAEADAAFLDVRAGDVQFQPADHVHLVQPSGHLAVILDRRAGHVHDHRFAVLAELGDLVADEGLQPDVGQPDRVEHARPGFDDARRGVALARVQRNRLGHQPAQQPQVHEVGILERVAAGPAGGQQRVVQADAGQVDRKVHVGLCRCLTHEAPLPTS
jgi:hypothetical protein